MAIEIAANMRQNISLAKIALLAAYSYGYHEKRSEKQEKKRRKAAKRERKREKTGKKARKNKRKGEESKRKREEKRGKGKEREESKRKGEESEGKREEKRSALSSLQKTKRSAYGLVAQGLGPMQPAYFDILALAFSTSSSLGRGSFLASITTWKTKSATHFCEKPRRWL